MARTKGSGWGGGPLLYQKCPHCGKKKAWYTLQATGSSFHCTWCKEYFNSTELKRQSFALK